MNIKFKNQLETLTLYVYGELDEYSSSNVKNIMDKVILSNTNCKKVVFDLSGVTFMDSTGIGLLIGRYKIVKKFNIPVYISGTTLATEKVLQLAGIFSIMPKL
ncbi:MAG: anti-sigma factor antagonist [Clostridia bacterium]|nr:anti-sigma factor antagonist [Clostridia bacterium]